MPLAGIELTSNIVVAFPISDDDQNLGNEVQVGSGSSAHSQHALVDRVQGSASPCGTSQVRNPTNGSRQVS